MSEPRHYPCPTCGVLCRYTTRCGEEDLGGGPDSVVTLYEEVEALEEPQQTMKRLVDALRFYANSSNWVGMRGDPCNSKAEDDYGEIARKALQMED